MTRRRFDLTTKLSRRQLPPRREPYWHRIALGEYVGFRPSTVWNAQGTWIARYRDDSGRQHYHSLGTFEELDHAIKAAREWLDGFRHSGHREPLTVALACRHYVRELTQQGRTQAAADAESRFSRTIYGTKLGATRLDQLRVDQVKAWRDGFPTIKAKSVNRELAALRAALNLAYHENLIQTNAAWRGVKPLRIPDGESTRRDRWLTAEERKALMAAAHPALAGFITALLLTAARPGELAACNVTHFDRTTGTLRIPQGKTGGRDIPLSQAMVATCQAAARNKLPAAPLFVDPDGRRWQRGVWAVWFREARRRAGLDDDVVLYTLRHTAISEMIVGGLDAFSVARLAGTSTVQIDKHYGHLIAERTREALDRVELL